MVKIGDLLDCDFSKPVEETLRASQTDASSMQAELAEYVMTDHIRSEHERLLSAMAGALESRDERVAVWVSAFFGAGKTSFIKKLGYALTQKFPCEVVAFEGAANLPAQTEGAGDWIRKLFDECEIRYPARTFALVLDDIGERFAVGGERVRNLRVMLEQFGRESRERAQSGRISGPAWIIITAEEKVPERLRGLFAHEIELTVEDIREAAASRVLRKKNSKDRFLRDFFLEHGAVLNQNSRLEGSSRRTELDEDQFVRFYPYFPYWIELAIDITAGIRIHPNAPKHLPCGSRTVVKQSFDLLTSDETRLADQAIGALVSIDKIYSLLEASIPAQKQHAVQAISEHCVEAKYPGMAARVVQAICLMEFAKTDLPRTAGNIAALLMQNAAEAPPLAGVNAILEHLKNGNLARQTSDGWTLHEYDFDELHRETAALEGFRRAVGTINPRPHGRGNDLIQAAKRSLARTMRWYTRQINQFNTYVTRSIEDIVAALYPLVDLPTDVAVLQRRLAASEQAIASLQRQVETLQERFRNFAGVEDFNGGGKRLRCDRTAYVIGLFGTGRLYVCELIEQNIGERARYFSNAIRLHSGPTPMIYSGHCTIRHVSRGQNPPTVTSRILEAVSAGYADAIFIYRHPLDSLLTNWVWWRTHIRDCRRISGIAQIYRNTEDLSSDLETHFGEFEAFAEGDSQFFADAEPGPRFLSFREFVEETELYLQSGITLSLRLEDFMLDPVKEFSKIADAMSVNVDLSGLNIEAPKSKPYRYRAAMEKAPGFRRFVEELDAKTKERIGRIGYEMGV